MVLLCIFFSLYEGRVVFWICTSSNRFAFILKLHHVCMQNIAIMHLLLWTFFSTFSAKNVSVLNTCRYFNMNFNFKSWLCQSDPKRPCGVKQFNNLPIWLSNTEKRNRKENKKHTCWKMKENWNTSRHGRVYVCMYKGTGTTQKPSSQSLYRHNDPSCSCVFYWIFYVLFRTNFGALIFYVKWIFYGLLRKKLEKKKKLCTEC